MAIFETMLIWLLKRANTASETAAVLCFIVFFPIYLLIYKVVGSDQSYWFAIGGYSFVIAMWVGLSSLFVFLLLVNVLEIYSYAKAFNYPTVFVATINMMQDTNCPRWKKSLFIFVPVSWILWSAALSTYISLGLSRICFL